MIYLIYINGTGWQYYDKAKTIEDVIKILDYVIYNLKIERFIVVEYNFLEDTETPIMTNVKQFERIKEELNNVSRGNQKIYRRT